MFAAALSRLAALRLSRTRRAESVSGTRMPPGPPGGPPGICCPATGCCVGGGFVVGAVAHAYPTMMIEETTATAAGTRSFIGFPLVSDNPILVPESEQVVSGLRRRAK